MNNDLISRSWLKNCAIPCEIHNGALTDLCVPLYQIDNAPTVPLPDFKEGYKQAIIDGKTNFSRPQGEWIPVSERLPEDLEPVNITWINHKPESYYKDIKDKPFTATGVYFKGKWYWWSTLCTDILAEYGFYNSDMIDEGIEIIAWQPLPEPYKKGGAEE